MKKNKKYIFRQRSHRFSYTARNFATFHVSIHHIGGASVHRDRSHRIIINSAFLTLVSDKGKMTYTCYMRDVSGIVIGDMY